MTGLTRSRVPLFPEKIAFVHTLVSLAEARNLRQLGVETPDLRVEVRRTLRPIPMIHPPRVAIEPTFLHPVRAPLTGIWYEAPSPGATPYVRVGSMVDTDTVIGLIETMKIFNEVTADLPGRVAEVHVRRGDLVTVHAPLISIDPGEVPGPWLPAV